MTPQQFIAKWKRATLTERSAAQQHFLGLCDLLGQPKPAEVDSEGSWYTFERGVRRRLRRRTLALRESIRYPVHDPRFLRNPATRGGRCKQIKRTCRRFWGACSNTLSRCFSGPTAGRRASGACCGKTYSSYAGKR